MRRLLLIAAGALALLGVLLWRALIPPSPLVPAATDFALSNVTVIEPLLSRREKATVRVGNGTLLAGRDAAAGRSAALADLEGTFVLPGLVDMHAHLPPATALHLTGYASFLYLAHGVTSIRDVGDTDGTSLPAARGGIARGDFPGPRIFSCGPFVAGGEPLRWPNTEIVREPADAERIAQRLRAAGHMCIKSYEDLTIEKIAALRAAAKRHGLQLLGHVPAKLSYEEALIPDVQHFFGVPPPSSLRRDHVLDRTASWGDVDDARLESIVSTTLAHGIINTPTLVSTHQLLLYRDYEAARRSPGARLLPRLFADVVWNPTDGMPVWRGVEDYLADIEDAVRKKTDLVRRLYRAGATLQLGTDAQQPFVAPGHGLWLEMGHFARADIPLEAIWAMATRQAAATLGVPGLGRLEAGAPADFLVFRRDPTQSLDHLDSLAAVVAQGRLYRRADLDRAREAYQRHYGGTLVDTISIVAARVTLGRTVLRDY